VIKGVIVVFQDLGLHFKRGAGPVKVSIFSPYWMINKTEQLLQYKVNCVSFLFVSKIFTRELI